MLGEDVEKVVIGDATLYCGEMEHVLGIVAPCVGDIDAIVTDPPYGIKESRSNNKSRSGLAKAKDYGALDWDNEPCSQTKLLLMQHASRWQIIFGGNYFDLPPSSCWLVWDKKNGANDFADCELAWTNLKKAVRKIEWMWHGMIRQKSAGGFDDRRVHPTQKPVGMMEWCVDQLPNDVGLICDPFMGSGTTGVAALNRGMKFVGIERERSYFDDACARIEKAVSQPHDMIAVIEKIDNQSSLEV